MWASKSGQICEVRIPPQAILPNPRSELVVAWRQHVDTVAAREAMWFSRFESACHSDDTVAMLFALKRISINPLDCLCLIVREGIHPFGCLAQLLALGLNFGETWKFCEAILWIHRESGRNPEERARMLRLLLDAGLVLDVRDGNLCEKVCELISQGELKPGVQSLVQLSRITIRQEVKVHLAADRNEVRFLDMMLPFFFKRLQSRGADALQNWEFSPHGITPHQIDQTLSKIKTLTGPLLRLAQCRGICEMNLRHQVITEDDAQPISSSSSEASEFQFDELPDITDDDEQLPSGSGARPEISEPVAPDSPVIVLKLEVRDSEDDEIDVEGV